MKQICPECGKTHKPGRKLQNCESAAQFDLGHYIILGLTKDDPKMVRARARQQRFADYQKTIGAPNA